MRNGGLILWNAVAVCDMSKTSWQTGKLRMTDDLKNHSKGQQFLSEQWLNIIRFHNEINQDYINLARKYYQESFLGYELIAGGIWKGDIFDGRPRRLEKLDASDISPRRINAKEVY